MYFMPIDFYHYPCLLLNSMLKVYNLYILEASFRNYLLSGNIQLQKTSIKNYTSDLRHFLGWVQTYRKFEVDSIENFHKRLTFDLIVSYKDYLTNKEIPIRTVRRRLSTIRKFFKYCIQEGFLPDSQPVLLEKHTDVKNKQNFEISSSDRPNKDNSLKHIIFFFIAFWFSFILGLGITIYFKNGIN